MFAAKCIGCVLVLRGRSKKNCPIEHSLEVGWYSHHMGGILVIWCSIQRLLKSHTKIIPLKNEIRVLQNVV
jgi:hypothetical protein